MKKMNGLILTGITALSLCGFVFATKSYEGKKTAIAHAASYYTITIDGNGGSVPYVGCLQTMYYQPSDGKFYDHLHAKTGEPAGEMTVGGEFTAHWREGYLLQGYYSAATGGSKRLSGRTNGNWNYLSLDQGFVDNKPTGNMTVYARWEARQFNVTLDKQGGTGGTASIKTTYDAAMPSITLPTKAGYNFDGYYDATSGGTKYYNANGTSARTWDKAPDITISLYARWTAATYTVTFNHQGGTSSLTTKTATYNAAMPAISSSQLPTKTAHRFDGYYDAAEGGTKYYNANGSSAKNWNKTSNATLYAHWTLLSYTVTLNQQNGTGGLSSVTAVYSQDMPTIEQANLPTREGATFGGYFAQAKGQGKQYYSDSGISVNTWDKTSAATIYAYWIPGAEAQAVIDLIDNIGTVSYPDSNVDITTARNAYESLSDALKSIVNDYNYATLTAAEAEYESLKQAGANAVKDLIDAIGEVSYPGSKDAIEGARAAYEALTDEQKVLVTNYATLTAAEAEYLAQRDAQIQAVVDVINALPEITTSNFVSDKPLVESARAAYEALTDEQKGLFDANVLASLVAKEELIATYEGEKAAGLAVKDLIDAIGTVSYPDSKDAIEGARAAYDALENDHERSYVDNLDVLLAAEARYAELVEAKAEADAVIAKIEAIGEVSYPESGSKIKDAKASYNALNSDGKSFVTNLTTLEAAEAEYLAQRDAQIQAVVDEINALPEITTSNFVSDKPLVESARDHYNALTDEQKGLFDADVLASLVAKEEQIATYEGEKAAGLAVKDLIDAIGEVTYPGSKDAIEGARAAYDALENDHERSYVDNLDVLVAAEARYQELKVEGANAVKDLIDAIGEVSYPGSKDAIEGARAAYEALTDEQKALINNEELQVLVNAEAEYSAQRDAQIQAVIDEINALPEITTSNFVSDKPLVESARAAYEALTDEQKGLFDANVLASLVAKEELIATYEGEKAAGLAVKDLIDAIGTVSYPDSKDAIEGARAAYDALENDHERSYVDNLDVLVAAEAEYEAVDDLVKDINDVESIVYGDGDDIDDLRDRYDALDNYLKGIFPEDTLQHLEDLEEAYKVIVEIHDIAPLTYDVECLDKIELAFESYEDLTDTQKALVSNYDDLLKYKADYDAVDDLAKQIEAVTSILYGDQDKIKDLRDAYNALSDDQKAFFPEHTLQHLVDLENAYGVIVNIHDIAPVEYTPECLEKIETARTNYDALTQTQKDLVSNYSDLVDAEKVYDAMDKISSIGEVEYSSETEELIKEAKEAYDALTEEQKEMVGDKYKTTLDIAIKNYESKKEGSNILVIIFIILASLALVGGGLFLFFFYKKKKDDKDDDDSSNGKGKKEPVKAMSLAIVPIILVSYYLTGPYIALYVIGGLALIIWIFILVVVILKKKGINLFKKAEPVKEAKEEIKPVDEKKVIETKVNSDGDEIVVTKDSKGNIFEIRFIKSFTAKIIQVSDEMKKYYEELKNEALSYKNTTSRTSWHFDSVNSGRNQVLKFAVRGKTLCVYFALNADEYNDSKYKVEKVESKKFEEVPCLYRIKNDRRLGYAKELIEVVMKKFSLEKGKEQHESYILPYEENKPLIDRGLIKEVTVQVNRQEEPEVIEKKVNADGDEIVVTRDSHGDFYEIRYVKSFTAKLSQGEKDTRDYYNILKNYVLSHKNANSRVSWHYDAINVGRKQILRFSIRGKTLCVYYDLNANDYKDTKYKVEKVETKKFEEVPCLYRIKNDRRLGYAKDLIDDLMKKFGVSKGKESNEDFLVPYESTQALLKKDLIRESKSKVAAPIQDVHKSITVEEADEKMSDAAAEAKISIDTSSKKHEGKRAILNIDTIAENFADGDVVDLEALWKKKLIAKNVGYVKVLARGQLDKKLNLDLQDYSIQAVKMVLLEGGTVKRAK